MEVKLTEYLNTITGLEWILNKDCELKAGSPGNVEYQLVYDLIHNSTYITFDGKIVIKDDVKYYVTRMELDEFICRIEEGDWV